MEYFVCVNRKKFFSQKVCNCFYYSNNKSGSTCFASIKIIFCWLIARWIKREIRIPFEDYHCRHLSPYRHCWRIPIVTIIILLLTLALITSAGIQAFKVISKNDNSNNTIIAPTQNQHAPYSPKIKNQNNQAGTGLTKTSTPPASRARTNQPPAVRPVK